MSNTWYVAVIQCISDCRDVWRRQASWLVMDLAMTSLRDDALALVRQARQLGDASPMIANAERLIVATLELYANTTTQAALEASFTELWALQREMSKSEAHANEHEIASQGVIR